MSQHVTVSEAGGAPAPISSDVVLSIADLVVDFPLEGRTVRAVDGLSSRSGRDSDSASSGSRGRASRP